MFMCLKFRNLRVKLIWNEIGLSLDIYLFHASSFFPLLSLIPAKLPILYDTFGDFIVIPCVITSITLMQLSSLNSNTYWIENVKYDLECIADDSKLIHNSIHVSHERIETQEAENSWQFPWGKKKIFFLISKWKCSYQCLISTTQYPDWTHS